MANLTIFLIEMGPKLAARLTDACARRKTHPAIEGTARALTYGELYLRSKEVSERLLRSKLSPNEPVVVSVSNGIADWIAFLGIWRARGVVVPVHHRTPDSLLNALIHRTGSRLILTAGTSGDVGIRAITQQTEGRQRSLLEDAALIIFTSGSTGQPKGTVLSHSALAGKLDAIASVIPFGEDTRSLLILQMNFIFGIWVSLITLLHGGCVFMHERFEAEEVLRSISKDGITTVAMVPTMVRSLFKAHLTSSHAVQVLRRSNLRQIIVGGEALGRSLHQAIDRTLPNVSLYDAYGTTETASSDFVLSPKHQPALIGTIGHVTPGVDYRIAGEDGRPLSAGEVGELQIRSAFVMKGYLDSPQLTADAFTDGYFRTGDLARFRADGAVEIVGRKKEIINRGGNKISPLEVEEALASHPSVAEVVVTSVPDALMGERLHALVVLAEGQAADSNTLWRWLEPRLERFKFPDAIHFGEDIPKGSTGKADRRQLREWVESGTLGLAAQKEPHG